MRIIFRADASHEAGTGHVMRCLTLADELVAGGAEALFICREQPGDLCALIRERGFALSVRKAARSGALSDADWHTDAIETLERLQSNGGADWLVVDHYGLDAKWEGKIRQRACRILVIDDLANRRHECDLLLDQNYYQDIHERYAGLLPATARQLLGPTYALLGKQFRLARKRMRLRDGTVRRILVFFGGADLQNRTEIALKGIGALGRDDISVDVVIGATNPHREALAAQCASMPQVTLHVQTREMHHLMAQADLAVGAGGSTTWERCCLGLPSLAWPVADNQVSLLKDAAADGLVYMPSFQDGDLSATALTVHLRALLENPSLIAFMAKSSFTVTDGAGAKRVASIMLNAHSIIEIRTATRADAPDIFRWRSDLSVTRYSRHSDPPVWEEHLEWIDRVLDDPNRQLLIGHIRNQPVGVLRFDISDTTAEISIYLVPGMQGKGLGRNLIQAGEHWLREHRPEIKTITAEVLAANTASHRLFVECGYTIDFTCYRKRFMQ